MRITDVRISFFKIIEKESGKITSEFNAPSLVIFRGKRSRRTEIMSENRFTREEYEGIAIIHDFIVIVTEKEYIFVWEDAKEHASLIKEDAGSFWDMDDTHAIFYKDEVLSYYDRNGECVRHCNFPPEDRAGQALRLPQEIRMG